MAFRPRAPGYTARLERGFSWQFHSADITYVVGTADDRLEAFTRFARVK